MSNIPNRYYTLLIIEMECRLAQPARFGQYCNIIRYFKLSRPAEFFSGDCVSSEKEEEKEGQEGRVGGTEEDATLHAKSNSVRY